MSIEPNQWNYSVNENGLAVNDNHADDTDSGFDFAPSDE